jgi:O-antigen/teichoic acid export membrane protein
MSLQLVLRIINSVFYSLQKSVIPDLLFTISNVIFLFLLIFFGGSENNGIVKMAWFHLISFSTPLLVATFYLYTFKLKWLCPGIKYLNKNSTFSLMKSGGLFFVIQLLALVISNTNELFISYFIGAKDVVEYKLYYSILGMPVSIIAILGNPLWSEISQARVHQNILWIRKILVRLLQLLGIFFILMLIVVLISQYLFDCWLGEGTIEVNNFYLIVMSIYCFFLLWNTFVSVIVMGIGVLKFPLVLLLVCSVADIYLTIEISKFISNWSSVVLANIVSLFIYCVFLSIWLFRYLGRRNENSSEIV